jgi:hypothetical protein
VAPRRFPRRRFLDRHFSKEPIVTSNMNIFFTNYDVLCFCVKNARQFLHTHTHTFNARKHFSNKIRYFSYIASSLTLLPFQTHTHTDRHTIFTHTFCVFESVYLMRIHNTYVFEKSAFNVCPCFSKVCVSKVWSVDKMLQHQEYKTGIVKLFVS